MFLVQGIPPEPKLPTRETYEMMSDAELVELLKIRDKQINDIRAIYENFHNEVEKRFRKMVLDYHDKALSLSKVHGDMQNRSLSINREALVRMREEDEAAHRDRKLVLTICIFSTMVYWYWLHRHYVRFTEDDDPNTRVAIFGLGNSSENIMTSKKRSGRQIDTPYEKELRQRKEEEKKKAAAAAAELMKVSSDGGAVPPST